jgi:hypothetical protein
VEGWEGGGGVGAGAGRAGPALRTAGGILRRFVAKPASQAAMAAEGLASRDDRMWDGRAGEEARDVEGWEGGGTG